MVKQKDFKALVIIQARMGSTRLPGKVMKTINGRPAIWHLLERLKYCREIDRLIIATTESPNDLPLAKLAQKEGWDIFRGSEENVLERYYFTAKAYGAEPDDLIVRVTGDDILTDPSMVDLMVSMYRVGQPVIHHVSNNRETTFPYGADCEAFSFYSLTKAYDHAKTKHEREHVTPYIRKHPELFPYMEVRWSFDKSNLYLSIDTEDDLRLNREIFSKLQQSTSDTFSLNDVIAYLENRKERSIL